MHRQAATATPGAEPFLEIHPATAKTPDIRDGEWVVLLETPAGAVTVTVAAQFNASVDPVAVTTQYG